MLADPLALEQVLFSDDGVAGALGAGQVLIDMSTVGPDTIRSVGQRLPEHVTLIDAPVRGSVPEATAGRLAIFAGAKLVANLVLGVAITALGEALALADELGLDRTVALDVLADTPIGAIVSVKRRNIESDSYPPAFKLRHALKDLHLVDQTAHRFGDTLGITAAARNWLAQATAEGAGDLDISAVVATIVAASSRCPRHGRG